MFDLAIPMLGLGALSSGFGAYSQMQAAQRQRDLYNQYRAQAQQMNNPAYQISQAQPYYQANLAALQQQIPTFMREQVNPMLGVRGLDPAGGQGQLIAQQALAPQISQAWQNALNTATGQQQGSLNALSGATGNIGQPYGQMGGLGNAMQSLMMAQAMNRYNQPQPYQRGSVDTTGLSGGGINPSFINRPGGGMMGDQQRVASNYTGYPLDEYGV